MRICSFVLDGREVAGIITNDGCIPVRFLTERFKKNWPEDLLNILFEQKLDDIASWLEEKRKKGDPALKELAIPHGSYRFAPLYRRPRKIWGIGLNYKEHADGLSERIPESEPASFMKPDTAIIGYGDEIRLPALSKKVTGEAELGLIIGKTCKNVELSAWKPVIAGITTVIDMTAEDILRRNPRNLTQSKSFDTFFSFGPILYTIDEIKDMMQLRVKTILNGSVRAENTVSKMKFPPDILVSYHSKIMTLHPGDIISTGTPGAVPLTHGDIVEGMIGDFHSLRNLVVDSSLVSQGIPG